ncbi:1-acyl-sn-glycerol-3-phosphate acyltransferase [Microvirga sp. VF16]|uniref:lysophospholipid acyltransferase family protein n=1 Tax=Microvirga sp. VF16 TaxID=2807101 RepID=UPI00193E165C|nr:lysophospholipid acyltransferase family protein [Microvirga sp. VF16]QRM34132.1 1-acyl-sn-glycerol-3-phosphate acyltransferase [Microvirga sp. VF16]
MQRIRSTLFDVLLAIWTGLFVPVLALLWLCGSPERGVRLASRLWARGILVSLKCLVGLTYAERGQHNIPDRPCLIIANHQSTWETLAFLILFPDVAIVAKQELLTIPVFSWFLRKSPMILIDRESGSKAVRRMVQGCQAALAQGRSVLIFPEGTRKPVSEPIEFKRGVELLYAKLDTPVLPVAVNSGHFWGPGRPYKRAGTISVSYLDPIAPGLAGHEFMRKAEELLEAETKSSWPQAA